MYRRFFQAVLVLALVLGVSLPASASALPPGGSGPLPRTQADQYAPDRLLVRFKPGTPGAVVAAVHRQNGGAVKDVIAGIDVQVVTVPAGQVPAKVAAYSHNPNVEFAEPDYLAFAIEASAAVLGATGPDTYLGEQWGMAKIQAPAAWDVVTGDGIRIAVLDTGIDQDHEDLSAGKVVANVNFTDSPTVDDLYGHGTHVAGIAAAVTNNGLGVAGVGYNASLMNVKVLNDSGSGAYSWISNGIIWAADNGARVVNMSLGGTFRSRTLQNAVDYAWNRNVVVVAAAGNSGSAAKEYPGGYDNAIAVAATAENDAKASFSNYGSWVDVAAPGVRIFSTLPNHDNTLNTDYGIPLNYGSLNGTSMATPYVAGLAALVWSSSYGTNAVSVRNRIESTADQIAGTGSDWVYGRINAYAAVTGSGTVTPPPPPPPSPDPTGSLVVTVSTDKGSYTLGEKPIITAQVTDGTNPVGGAAVHFEVTTASGRRYGADVTTDSSGVARVQLSTKKPDGTGTYTVQVAASKAGFTAGTASTTFEVN